MAHAWVNDYSFCRVCGKNWDRCYGPCGECNSTHFVTRYLRNAVCPVCEGRSCPQNKGYWISSDAPRSYRHTDY